MKRVTIVFLMLVLCAMSAHGDTSDNPDGRTCILAGLTCTNWDWRLTTIQNTEIQSLNDTRVTPMIGAIVPVSNYLTIITEVQYYNGEHEPWGSTPDLTVEVTEINFSICLKMYITGQ
ncbi:MAG: hypothetical protein KOO62_09175 [candidate division Zixibacteria bacterium]|nr:hypothetical protein [candidate division Zixibacteria bacterium]